jgi:hypothetical protein
LSRMSTDGKSKKGKPDQLAKASPVSLSSSRVFAR